MLDHRLKREEGSLTVEATLIIGVMVIFLTAWILILHLFKIQAYTQHALDQTALNLSDEISMVHSLGEGIHAIGDYLKASLDLRPPSSGEGEDSGALGKMTFSASAYLALNEELSAGRGKVPPALSRWVEGMVLNTTIDDDRDMIHLDLTYEIKLPGPLQAFGPKIVHQNAGTGIWLLTDDPISWAGGKSDEDKDKKERGKSIWQESNFSRGRKFAEKYRGGASRPLPTGQGIDFIDERGRGVALFSLNIFSDSYSGGTGRDPGAYRLKREALSKRLTYFLRQTRKNVEKIKARGSLESPPQSGHVLLILPEEAKHFSGELEGLARELEKKEGVSMSFVYDQKAWVVEEDDEKK